MKTKLHTIWLTALMMLFCQSIFAETFEANGIYYIITSSTEMTVRVIDNPNKYSGNVSIPNLIQYSRKTYKVTSIGSYAFSECPELTSIDIPGSVKEIGECSFLACPKLASINIPKSLTHIGEWAFDGCAGLTCISIPSNVISIGEGAFNGCSGLTSISVDTNNSVYDSRNNCNAIIETSTNSLLFGCKETIIPNSVTSIGNWAFYGFTGLTSISIPNSVTNIGAGAFSGCTGLTSFFIPNSITEIGDNAFYGCNNLKKVYNESTLSIWKGSYSNGYVAYYADYVFNNCQTDGDFLYINQNGGKHLCGYIGKETNLVFPEFNGIAAGAFEFCTNITSVTIPNSMTFIGNESFKNCTSLQHISIPNSISSIGTSAFQGCTSLSEISLPNSMTSISKYLLKECTGLTNVSIPNSVTNIGYGAFQGCTGLASASIPNSVTNIDKYAFTDCTGLTSISIPNSMTSIGNYTFSGCTGLTSISIPNSVTTIGGYAFQGCTGLTSISIPNSMKSIGDYTFAGCTGLTSISIPNSMKSIGNYAFQDCTGLASVSIPNSVTTIGKSAFGGCTGLTSFSISNNISSIGESAFPINFALFNEYENGYYLGNEGNPYCALYYVKKPESNYYFIHKDCKYINASQSYGLYSSLGSGMKIFNFSSVILNANNQFPLRNLYIYDNCCKMDGDYVFSQKNEKKYVCGYLGTETELVLPDADGIYYAAFINSDLNNVSISDNTTDICEKAFYGCSKMAHIIVPQNITSIGAYAFSGCTSLKKVYNCSSLRLYLGSTSNGSVALYANYVYNYCQKNGDYILTIPDDKKYVCGYLGKETHLVFPQADGIYTNAFRDSQNIYKVTLSSNMTYIGNSAFYNCKELTDISFSNKLTHIGDSAFQNCNKLANVILPNSLTTIGAYAFSGCTGATKFSIPQRVTNIGSQAFGNCSGSLTLHCDTEDATDYTGSCFYNANFSELFIGHEVEKIGNYAFYGMNTLQKIHIGSKVNRIGNNAFGNCTGLKGIYINALTPPRCRNSLVFHDDTKWDCPLYVPGPSINDYKSADVWKDFITIKEYEGYSNGIEEIALDALSAPKRNLLGQKLSAPIKGKVYIQNDKKFLTK